MNLNSYIGLLGRGYCEEKRKDGLWLVATPEDEADFSVPESDYLLTLDADSMSISDLGRYQTRIPPGTLAK